MAIIKRETGRGFAAGDSTSFTLTNSAAETVMFNHTIVGGQMGLNKEVNFRIICTLTTPAVLPPTLTIKLKFGSSTLTIMSGLSLTGSLAASPFIIEGMIANAGTANSQIVYAKLTQANSAVLLAQPMAYADWTIDTTADQTFQITAQFSVATALTSLVYKHANVDLT